jgi:WD40 repeat protein/transcriptional regulator with XRE-family HTH domain
MTTSYHDLDSTFANLFVTLRTNLGLTQATLAERLGVTDRAIQRWEAGTRYPKAEYLRAFLALCLKQHAFPAGHEVEQARTLWRAAHLKVLFDEQWVLTQLAHEAPSSTREESDIPRMPQSIAQRVNWGEDGSEVSFYGRESEQAHLTAWIREERCRLIALLGMGGIGKSALAVTLLHQLAPTFSVAAFRSVRDAIPCEELVADLIQIVAPEPIADIPATVERRIALLLKLLQTRRCLLVLDNMEALLQEGKQAGEYRVGYESYELLLERLATTQHQSCVLLTSREKPAELKPLEGSRTPVRALHLSGLDEHAGEQILAEKQLQGNADARRRLIEAYSGNPLALKIVAETIRQMFGGDIVVFLAEGHLIFQGVRALLAQQFARLSFLEQSVLRWLAIVREPTDVTRLLSLFVASVARLQLLEALEDLRRRSLIEHGQRRTEFTLQSVVMEFVTDELVKQVAEELQRREPDALLTYGLALASAKEYIRRTQERLLLVPVLASLGATPQRTTIVEQHLQHSLNLLRSLDSNEQGYGPTNITMLLHALKGQLQGVDLSHCRLREAFLQGVQMQDASLRSAFIQESTFTEKFGIVLAVAVSNDGKYWAAGMSTGDVRVFLGGSSTPLFVLQAHTSVSSIAFSPTRCLLATGGRGNLVKIWNLEDGHLLATLHEQSDFLMSVTFSPDGRQLATGSLDGTVRMWSLASFELLHLLHAHEEGVAAVAWSPAGHMLASAENDGIRLWDAHSGRTLQTLDDVGNIVYRCAFSPDSQFLVSGGTDGLVKVWHIPSRTLLHTLEGHTSTITAVAWSPDGQVLASGSFDTTIRIWNADSATAQQILVGHIDVVRSVAFTGDSLTLFSGSSDRSVRLWEIASGSCVRLMQGYFLSCFAVAWNPRDNILASGTSDGQITLWTPTDKRPRQVLRGHTQTVCSVTWSPDGTLLTSGSNDQTIRLWKAQTGECFAVLHGHTSVVRATAWSPDGRMLASGSDYDEIVRVWDIEKRQSLWMCNPGATFCLAWSPDGAYLVSGGSDSTLQVWQGENGTLLKTFQIPQRSVSGVGSVAWSPDSNLLACCCGTKVFVWDVTSGMCLHTLPLSILIYTLAWSATGQRLLVGGEDGTVSWWDTDRWTYLTIRREHKGIVRSMSIRPDGRTAASADNNGIIIIWDMEQAIPLNTLRPDRPYERLDISGIQGITEAQKMTMRELGAVGN